MSIPCRSRAQLARGHSYPPAVSFDDDAAGEGAGFRPPPHPDDRLWRHPSEIVGAGQVGLRAHPRQRWPWGVVVAVGTVGVVMVTLGGALYLGLRSQVGGVQTGEQAATTTDVVPPPPGAAQPAWLGIEGYDQVAAIDSTTVPGSTEPVDGTEAPGPTEGTEPVEAGDGFDDGSPASGEYDSPPRATSTTGSGATLPAGVMVAEVDPEGPAAEALHPGDIVVEVNGEPVTDMDALLEALQGYEPGDEVEITYKTVAADDTESTGTAVVTLAERPESLSAGAAGER